MPAMKICQHGSPTDFALIPYSLEIMSFLQLEKPQALLKNSQASARAHLALARFGHAVVGVMRVHNVERFFGTQFSQF
jgi:hypothetical protein